MSQESRYVNEEIIAKRLYYAIGVDLIEQSMYYLGLPVRSKLKCSLEAIESIKVLIRPKIKKLLEAEKNFNLVLDVLVLEDMLSERILNEYQLKILAY